MPLVVYSGTPGVHSPVSMTVVNESTLVGAVITASTRHRPGGAGGGATKISTSTNTSTTTSSTTGRRRDDAALVDAAVGYAFASLLGSLLVAAAWAATMASLLLLCPRSLIAPADFV